MIEHFLEHTLFEFFDFLGFLVLVGVIFGGIWIYERWLGRSK